MNLGGGDGPAGVGENAFSEVRIHEEPLSVPVALQQIPAVECRSHDGKKVVSVATSPLIVVPLGKGGREDHIPLLGSLAPA